MKSLIVLGLILSAANARSQTVSDCGQCDQTVEVVVSGLIEDRPFRLTSQTVSGFGSSCLAEIHAYNRSADEIFFSVNNNRFVTVKRAYDFKDQELCDLLEKEIHQYAKGVSQTSIKVVGLLERSAFSISAVDRNSLLLECINAFTATQLTYSDEMTYSVNGSTFKRLTTYNRWSNPVKACKALLTSVDPML